MSNRSWDPEARSDFLRAQAESQGLGDRLERLALDREEWSLDLDDALDVAAEELGIAQPIDALFDRELEPLFDGMATGLSHLRLSHAHADMPTLRIRDDLARIWLPPAPVGPTRDLVRKLIERWREAPDHQVWTVETGLGGSGGCACGEPLPEDAPAGPLFTRPTREQA